MAEISESEQRLEIWRRRIGLVLGPLALAFTWLVPLSGLTVSAHRLAAVLALVVVFWVTEAIPLAATALLGPALVVLLGVASAEQSFAPFADPLIFMFMGGFMLAGALTTQGFDRRAALWIVARRVVAGSPVRAMIAVVVVSFAFSMWISNTATTAMLVPIVLGLHTTIRAGAGDDPRVAQELDRWGGGVVLAMAYAASIGGMATPIGTPPNIVAVGMLEERTGVHIDFLQWMRFALPTALVLTAAMVWIVARRFPSPIRTAPGLRAAVQHQLAGLGAMKPGERRAVAVFGLAIAGWLTPSVFRLALGSEHALTDWAHDVLDEGVVAIVCGSLAFLLPSGKPGASQALLTWDDAQKLDWGALMLLGGGLALGRLTFSTGLADAIGRGVLALAGPLVSHPLGLAIVAVGLVLVMTEFTSNLATTSMMLPVILAVAQEGGMDPMPAALAITLAASCAFVLPVSTPPNAIAYGTRLVRLDAMIAAGIRLDLVAYVVLVGMVILLPWLRGT